MTQQGGTLPVVLCVDDEEGILRSLERCFFTAGYRILTALSGPEALDILKRLGGKVDMIICDHTMPGMKGEEFLSIARSRYGKLAAIMLSGYTNVEVFNCNGQPVGFMEKPWHNQALREAVRDGLRPALRGDAL
ncbi:MAG: response regulator [Candidatus Omnitrophica bacterium]|nr:response regulator [Candidatus Omnitrophota bacterium]